MHYVLANARGRSTQPGPCIRSWMEEEMNDDMGGQMDDGHEPAMLIKSLLRESPSHGAPS